MTAIEPDIDVQIGIAARQLQLARDNAHQVEMRLLGHLCKKFGCLPGSRVIRTNTAVIKAKRPIWIVTKAFISNLDATIADLSQRPRIWARRLDHHNIPSSHYEKQLWSYWEPAP